MIGYTNKAKKVKYKKIKLFDDDWKDIQLPLMPTEEQSIKELKQVITAHNNATAEQVELYKKTDKEPSYYLMKYMDEKGLKYDKESIDEIQKQLAVIIAHYKNAHNRPRPWQVAKRNNVKYKHFDSVTAQTPSYPSGHTVQPVFVALVYGEKHPEHAKTLRKIADATGMGRVHAGLHFPTDIQAGQYLAERLMPHYKTNMIKEEYGAGFEGTSELVNKYLDDTPYSRPKKKRFKDLRK